MASGAKRFAEAVAKKNGHQRTTRYAVVLQTEPLRVELVDASVTLDEDDLILSDGFRKYLDHHGVQPEDTVVVHEMNQGEFHVGDVVSGREGFEGIDTHVQAEAQDTHNGPIIGKLEVFDAQGNHVGWVPVYEHFDPTPFHHTHPPPTP